MKVAIHGTVPFWSKRLGIWQKQGGKLGMELIKHTDSTPLQGIDVLVIGPNINPKQLTQTLHIPTTCQLVADSWIQACIAAGKLLPTAEHAPGAAAAAAGGQAHSRPTVLGKRAHGQPDDSTTTTTTTTATAAAAAAVSPSSKRARLVHQPTAAAAAAAAVGAVGTAQTADAVRAMLSSRAWLPAAAYQQQQQQHGQQQQQQHGQQQQQQHGQQQQQQQLGVLLLQQEQPAVLSQQQPQLQQQQQQQQQQNTSHHPQPVEQLGLMLLQQNKQQQHEQQQGPHLQDQQHQQQQQQQQYSTLDVSWMPAAAIRVVSYNILADMYINGGSKPYCPAALRTWSSRWPRLAAELAAYTPHILGLQEVDESRWLQDIQPWMQTALHMTGLYWSRVYERNRGVKEGIVLGFNRHRFRLLHHTAVRFAANTPPATTALQAAFWHKVAQFEEGALFALLHDTSSNQPVCVACTHLWFNPKDQDVKVGQTHIACHCLVEFIKGCQQQGLLKQYDTSSSSSTLTSTAAASESAAAAAPTDQQQQQQQLGALLAQLPVVFCGDFNSLWRLYTAERGATYKPQSLWPVPACGYSTSGVYELLANGRLTASHRHHPTQWRKHIYTNNTNSTNDGGSSSTVATHRSSSDSDPAGFEFNTCGLQLQSAYLAARGAEPPITNKHPGFAGCLDYVWFSANRVLDVIGTLAMPYELLGYAHVSHNPALVPFDSIPNGVWPSDHLAIGAVLQLKDGAKSCKTEAAAI